MQHPDQKYIEALLHNNDLLIEEIYRKFTAKIKWMVLRNNGTEDDAADLFQEALVAIYHKARDEQFELTCPFDAFLFLICRKKWLNILNKRKSREVTNLEEEEYSYGEDSFRLAEDVSLQEARLTLLRKHLSQLGDSCKELLKLSWSGKSMEEVAEMLDFTYGYARKKKSECMAKLVDLVKKSPDYSQLKW